ncbi:MAG: hypothetical protein PHV16_03180 [Candidatus Nanoarchaeia archaeon]|nr:hypothetical protein [Candidatus Nanoarchaeia archaeon]
MKITVDTKEDSVEELKKLIRMLSSIVGENYEIKQKSEEIPEVTEGTFNMFNDSKTEESKEQEKEQEEFDINNIETY